MKICKIWLVVLLLLGTGFGFMSAATDEGRLADERNEEALLKYLRPALRSAGGFGRLYYSTACYAKGGYPIFPRLDVQPPSKRKSGLAAVREIFGPNKLAVVTQDQSGMIRVTIGNPASAILQTRIGVVTLEPIEQYNPTMAINAITNSKEVEAAMRKLGVKIPTVVTAMSVVTPERGLPRLPKSLKNMTVDQALDLVAKTFGGITSYGACTEPSGARFFYLDYFNVEK